MRRIELFTEAGEFVAVVEILPFHDHAMPKVVVWGARTFVLNEPYPNTLAPEKPLAVQRMLRGCVVDPVAGVAA